MSLAIRPITSLVARAAGQELPTYVTREQALGVVAAATTQRHRLLVRTLWESGGRVSEVLRLRRGDVDRIEASLVLINLKQRDPKRRRKVVYVSRELAIELDIFARDLRMAATAYYFSSQKSDGQPMSRQQCWEIVTRLSRAAGVHVLDGQTLRAATGLDFRHGAAIDMLRGGTPFPEVGAQLGHARADTTLIYTRLVSAERRAYADRRFGAVNG
jgi:integrase